MKVQFAENSKPIFVVASILTGILLMVAMLVVLLLVPKPVPSEVVQATRVLLSLGAGFAGGGLLGTLKVEGNFKGIVITATGGFAVFVIVYLFEPGVIHALGLL